MSRASLVLTDELIEAARAAGNLPPQPDEDEESSPISRSTRLKTTRKKRQEISNDRHRRFRQPA